MIRADSRKVYVIRTEDVFAAMANGMLRPDQTFLKAGSLWCELAFTEEQVAQYTFPKHTI